MTGQISKVKLAVMAGQRRYAQLRDILDDMEAKDIARFLEELPEEQLVAVFRMLGKKKAMETFTEINEKSRETIVKIASNMEMAVIMDELEAGDAFDVMEEMPAALVRKLLGAASEETRIYVNRFFGYDENTAGALMGVEFIDLKADMTVEEAIDRLRKIGTHKDTIYTCYVMNKTRVLTGVVTVKDLLMANDNDLVGEIMEADVISVYTGDEKEEAARIMAKYSFISLPVVDNEARLVGIITVDEAVDVLVEETTEDFEKMAAMAPSDEPYLETRIVKIAKNRFMWLLILMFSSMITGGILGHYDTIFSQVAMLVAFIPMLTDTGGNAGSQSSTLVIRGLALGEIKGGDIGAVIWKEARVSLIVALPLAGINLTRIALMYPGQFMVGLTVSLTMIFTVILANSLGAILPILAKALKVDPALMATPLISTLVDAFSLIIYFTMAKILIGI